MRSYGRLETGFWQNPRVKALSERGRLLLTYLFSCPHGNSIGCFILPLGYIMADHDWTAAEAEACLAELTAASFIKRDPSTGLILIVGWFGHNRFENPNVARAAAKTLGSLPQKSPVFEAFVAMVSNLGGALPETFRNEVAKLSRPRSDEVRNYVAEESETKEPKPKPKPEPKPEPKPDPVAAAPDDERWKVVGEKACELAGLDAGRLAVDFREPIAWLAAGLDPDLDIYPTITAMASREGYAPKGLKYFTNAIRETRDRRKLDIPSKLDRRPPDRQRPAMTVGSPEWHQWQRDHGLEGTDEERAAAGGGA